MARITSTGYCNFDTTKEPALFDRQGGVRHSSGEIRQISHVVLAREEEPSAGTSSSTFGSKPAPSGSSAQGTESSTQSHAPSAGSHSGQGQQPSQAPSSTASSTGGSGQGTGQDPALHPDSSEGSAAATPATPATTDGATALHMAREAYDSGDYALAEELLDEAENLDPSLAPEVSVARTAVLTAKTAK